MEASWKILLVLFLRTKPHSLIFNDYDYDDDDDDDNGKIIFHSQCICERPTQINSHHLGKSSSAVGVRCAMIIDDDEERSQQV